MKRSKLRYGMVGGDLNAFIGDVHRKGAAMNENVELVAGCFSRREEANRATGLHYGLDLERIYADFETMALKRLAEEKGLLFGLNYSHSGNVMVHEARALVRDGVIGEIINVNGEYFQEYLVDDIGNTDKEMLQLSSWRKDPAISGGSNCVGDIGSHIEHTVSYITGLELKRVCAMLDNYGQPLDLNANILVEFDNGCHGVFSSSQVCVGHLNGLVLRIFGTKGAI